MIVPSGSHVIIHDMIVFTVVLGMLTLRGGDSQSVQEPHLPCSNSVRLYPDPNDCRAFFRCANRKLVKMSCPSRTEFDVGTQTCAWRDEMSACTDKRREASTGQADLHNHTQRKGQVSTETTKIVHGSSIWGQAMLTPIAVSNHLKPGPVRGEIQLDYNMEHVQRNNKSDPDFANPVDHARMGFNFGKANLKNVVGYQPSPTMIAPSAASTPSSNNRPATTGGDKWYHKMNEVAATTSTLAQHRHRSRHISTPYQTEVISHVTNGSREDDTHFDSESVADDLHSRPDSTAVQSTPFDESSHVASYQTSTSTTSNADRVSGSDDNFANISTERSSDGFHSLNPEHVPNTTAVDKDGEVDNEIENSVENEDHTATWIDNVDINVSNYGLDVTESRHDGLAQINMEPSVSFQKTTPLPYSGDATVSSNDTEDKRDLPEERPTTDSPDKELNMPDMMTAPSNFSQVRNDNETNLSFEELAQLIEPYRARLDRKSYQKVTDTNKDNLSARLTPYTNSAVNQGHTWTSGQAYIPSALIGHLTGTIVNRDQLIEVMNEKAKPRWYDPEVNPDKYTVITAAATVTTPTEEPPSVILMTSSSPEITETYDGSGQAPQMEQETMSREIVDRYPTVAKKVYDPNGPEQAAETFPDASASVYVAETYLEYPSVAGYNVYAPQLADRMGPVHGDQDVNFMSAPYLVTGLTRPFRCPVTDGHFPDPKNCAVYYHCSRGQAYRRDCPRDQIFHPSVQSCVSSSLAPPCSSDNIQEEEDTSAATRSLCKGGNGLVRDQLSCSNYFECTDGSPLRRKCMTGTVFDDVTGKCSWSKYVPGCEQEVNPEVKVDILAIGRFQCPRDGYFRNPGSCDVYYLCAGGRAMRMTCHPGTSFDKTLNMCVWSRLVDGCDDLKPADARGSNSRSVNAHKDIARAGPLRSSHKKTVTSPVAPFSCPEAHGLYSDPHNCSFFIHCFKKIAYRHQCQPGTVFSSENAACTWRRLVKECREARDVKDGVQQGLGSAHTDSKKERRDIGTEPYQQRVSVSGAGHDIVGPVGLQEFTCPAVADGFYRDGLFCDMFHRCVVGRKFTFTCPTGTFFRLEENLCDFWQTVTDCTHDGLRLRAMGRLPAVLPPVLQSLDAPQPVDDEMDVSVVSTDADPMPCPAASGLFPHPRNCHQFLFCTHFLPLVLTCPDPLLYNSQTLTCDYASKVQCFRFDRYTNK